MKHLPAFKAALAAAAGIFIGRLLQEYSVVFLTAAIISFVVSVGYLFLWKERTMAGASILAYITLFLAFMFYMSVSLTSLSGIRQGDFSVFTGKVDEVMPDTSKPSIILTDCYGYHGGWQTIHGDLVLSPKSPMALEAGDRIIFTGKTGTLSQARNPGQFNSKNYYMLNGLAGRVYLRSRGDIIGIQHRGGFGFQRSIIQPIRDFVRNRDNRFLAGDVSGLAKAMVIGERSGINREMNENFMNSGTIHILSVSGLHIGFFTGILMALASIVRVPRRLRFFLIAPVLILYAFVVGMTPSVVRAVIMAIVVLFGLFLQRKSRIVNSLGFAALVILTFSPSQLFSPGFQLSFAAVLSIAFFYDRMTSSLKRSHPELMERPLMNSLISATFLTIAATLGTVPLSVYYFERVSLVSILANLLIVPLSGVFTSLNFTFLAISLFSSSLASLYAAAAQVIGFLILKLNSVMGSWSVSIIRIGDSVMLFSFLYMVWLIAVYWFGKNSIMKKVVFAVLLGADMVLFAGLFTNRAEARLFILDAGQGDAIYVELPNRRNMLIDAGMKFGNYDCGSRVVVPFLRRRGVDHLDYFVVTHLHSDHIGGAVSVLRNIEVRNFIYPEQLSHLKVWTSTMASVRALNIPARIARAGLVLDSGSIHRVYVLHPNRKYVGETGLSYKTRFNDGSIVLKVCVGKESVLLTGDAEKRVEHELVKTYDSFLASGILKAGHHGSITSSSEELLKSVRPLYAVISVGTGNRFGHPSREVIRNMNQSGIEVWRTDSLGAAVFKITTGSSEIVQWR